MTDKDIQLYARQYLLNRVNKYRDLLDITVDTGEEDIAILLEHYKKSYEHYHKELAKLDLIIDVGEHIGLKLKEIRYEMGLTQREFASRAGISCSFLSLVERGLRTPHAKTLKNMAKGLGIDNLI